MASALSNMHELIAKVQFIAQIDQDNQSHSTDWRDPLIFFFKAGEFPEDLAQAKLFKRKVTRFTLIGNSLYKRAFSHSLLKSLSPEEVNYVMREIHEGCYSNHIGARTLARKVLLADYFWPNLQKDVAHFVDTYLNCQKH